MRKEEGQKRRENMIRAVRIKRSMMRREMRKKKYNENRDEKENRMGTKKRKNNVNIVRRDYVVKRLKTK